MIRKILVQNPLALEKGPHQIRDQLGPSCWDVDCPVTALEGIFLIKYKAFVPNMTEAFKHFWRQYHEGGYICFFINWQQYKIQGDGVAIVFDGDHLENHKHGGGTNDEESGRLELLLAITEEANRIGLFISAQDVILAPFTPFLVSTNCCTNCCTMHLAQ